jgi:hypothetical protein
MRVAKAIELDEHTERRLRVLAEGRRVQARLQQRAVVVLMAAAGLQIKDISIEAEPDRRQLALWRQRFLDEAASMRFARMLPVQVGPPRSRPRWSRAL